ncbi:isoprenylcysteine carboxylmethyltransferase family protein [Jiella sp. MQZ9-1]|uniref:Isoprenylcysteine carboxylmethyltransferase family protein n=1 Tax=Jiella flava TaxID=2816857 RepID=A0A939G2A1_9HYPH|nr:protein-S-isoprenylcysteine O-methyltransferase [Jiella flava]MBO0663887.1 isoprenylcysteine carboxylmethyltransferase family protein [Jiella flava]MCD2472459.1 isoprenylcysteine carboxylmethyltransferase family protein [Jiella flava]
MTTVLTGKIAWVLLVIGWYVIRYPFERRAKRRRVEKSARGRAETIRMLISLCGLGIVPGIVVATGFPSAASYVPSPIQTGLGLLALVFALVLFRLTHKALGKMWSVSLDIREKHELVTKGIYRHVRHPMYTAFWTMALAQALLLPNLVAGLAGLIGFGTLYFLRVGPEEAMMEETFGDEYRTYRARTARLIPGIY